MQGLFSLAQAKYSMGPIGQQQYDMEMQASSTVHITGERTFVAHLREGSNLGPSIESHGSDKRLADIVGRQRLDTYLGFPLPNSCMEGHLC